MRLLRGLAAGGPAIVTAAGALRSSMTARRLRSCPFWEGPDLSNHCMTPFGEHGCVLLNRVATPLQEVIMPDPPVLTAFANFSATEPPSERTA